jgi:hypothetical protein
MPVEPAHLVGLLIVVVRHYGTSRVRVSTSSIYGDVPVSAVMGRVGATLPLGEVQDQAVGAGSVAGYERSPCRAAGQGLPVKG